MKIIQIIDVRWYNASADFAIKQAVALTAAGHDIMLLANPGSPPAQKARQSGLETDEEIDFSRTNIFKSANDLVRLAGRFNPDVIFAHRGESHLAGALAARRIGCSIARFRGDVRPPRKDIFSRILNERMTHGIAVSTNRLKDQYEKIFRLNGVPVQVIYPGIDSGRYHFDGAKADLKTSFGLDPDKLAVGMVGRLSPVKGHEYFLKAARAVTEELPEIQFVVAGEDAQLSKEALAGEAARLGIQNIRFFGLIENIEKLTASLDIGVIASIGSEMICRVLLEYFAAGIAVVATEINQVAELTKLSNCGLMVPPGDSEAMARALLRLCRDRTERNRLSRSAREWVSKNGSLEQLARDSERFLEGVINEQTVGNTF